MKKITVSLDEETYRRAQMKAAGQDTSVSAVVKKFLIAFAESENESERLKRKEQALRAMIDRFSAGDRLSRDEAHERDS